MDMNKAKSMSFFQFSFLPIYLNLKSKSSKDLEPFLNDGLNWKSVLAGVRIVTEPPSSAVTLTDEPELVSTQPEGTNKAQNYLVRLNRIFFRQFMNNLRSESPKELDQGSISSAVYAKLLRAQIPKVQKYTDDLTLFLCFWDLCA